MSREEFDELVARNEGMFRNLVSYRCNHNDSIYNREDLYQDFLLKLWVNADLIDFDRGLSSFCHTMIKRMYITGYKKAFAVKRDIGKVSPIDVLNVSKVSEENPEQAYYMKQVFLEIEGVVGDAPGSRIKKGYDMLVEWASGVSYNELSESHELPMGTVKASINAARTYLSERIKVDY